MVTRYAVSDGKLVLNLEAAKEGGYIVTSPLNPELITEAETIEEAFADARDASQALKQARAKLPRRRSAAKSSGSGQLREPPRTGRPSARWNLVCSAFSSRRDG